MCCRRRRRRRRRAGINAWLWEQKSKLKRQQSITNKDDQVILQQPGSHLGMCKPELSVALLD